MCIRDSKELSVEFAIQAGIVRAVDGVSFRVRPATTVAIVGESGSGKSTVAQAIMGILPKVATITDGQILFSDVQEEASIAALKLSSGTFDIASTEPSSKKMQSIRGSRISMIFQEPMTSLSPLHTVGDQIMEAMMLHSDLNKSLARDAVTEMLKVVGFPNPINAIDTYPFELSGGLRQRAMIAMALVCRPALLIADEPTTALDVTIQAQVINLLMDLQAEQQISFLFISHDMAVVERIAHRVAVMYAGEIVEIGGRRDVFNNPQHSYTKKLLGSVPVADPRQRKGSRAISIDEIPSVIHPVGYEPVHLPFRHVRDNHYVRDEV